MEKDIIILSKIAFIDKILDDFEDEFGDIPKQIKNKEADISHKKAQISETEKIIKDIKAFVSTSKITLVALKEKDDKLAKQQFLVRNNKEFDAITAEIKTIQSEHEKLSVRMRTEGQKETNLNATFEIQKIELNKLIEELDSIHKQFDELSKEHSEEVKNYNDLRKKLREEISDELFDKYAAIRKRISDAAVPVKKGSCNGCYRQIPQQIIVDMRNQHNRVFQCENCGRLLIPIWAEIDEEEFENL
jgi:predicted  nucleic acid-binding Zn-ribbon protein